MTLTINLSPELESQLNALAESQGVEAEDLALRLLQEKLCDEKPSQNGSANSTEQRPLTREELEAKLVAAGVRLGNRERAIALLDSWIGRDLDPDSTDEEWAEIQRNIEQGNIELRHADV
jgi:hypothetical protein